MPRIHIDCHGAVWEFEVDGDGLCYCGLKRIDDFKEFSEWLDDLSIAPRIAAQGDCEEKRLEDLSQ